MKYIIRLLSLSLALISSHAYAADIDTGQTVRGTSVLVQQQCYNGAQWVNQKCDSFGVVAVNIAKNETSIDPLFGTTFLLDEETAATSTRRILTTIAGSTITVKKYSIISMDTVNKGVFQLSFNSDGSNPFAKGYIGTAPSGTGDTLYHYGTSQGIWVTVPGACVITIQYNLSGL